jgi:hypothetical protein
MAKAVCIVILLLVCCTLLSPAVASHHRILKEMSGPSVDADAAGALSPIVNDADSCKVQCKLVPASAESKEALDLGNGPVEFYCDCY